MIEYLGMKKIWYEIKFDVIKKKGRKKYDMKKMLPDQKMLRLTNLLWSINKS